MKPADRLCALRRVRRRRRPCGSGELRRIGSQRCRGGGVQGRPHYWARASTTAARRAHYGDVSPAGSEGEVRYRPRTPRLALAAPPVRPLCHPFATRPPHTPHPPLPPPAPTAHGLLFRIARLAQPVQRAWLFFTNPSFRPRSHPFVCTLDCLPRSSSIRPFVCPPDYRALLLSFRLSALPFACPSVCLPHPLLYQPVCLLICLTARLFVCSPVCLPARLSTRPFNRPPVCLPVSLSAQPFVYPPIPSACSFVCFPLRLATHSLTHLSAY